MSDIKIKMSRISQELFNGSKFYVSRFEMDEGGILLLSFTECGNPKVGVRARFSHVRRLDVDRSSGDDGGFAVPWAIVRFECEEYPGLFWVFRLFTDAGVLEFESDWPEITKVA